MLVCIHCTNLSYVIEVSCWILTGERQTAVIRSKYVQVLLNQDMSFFDTYGNNGDIVSQVLSDVLLIQSALSEKVCLSLIYCLIPLSQPSHTRSINSHIDLLVYASCLIFLIPSHNAGWKLYS